MKFEATTHNEYIPAIETPNLHEQRIREHLERFAPDRISVPPVLIRRTPQDTLQTALKTFGINSAQYRYAKQIAWGQLKGETETYTARAFDGLCWLVENES